MAVDERSVQDGWQEHLKIILREYLESLLIAGAIALLIRFFVISAYQLPGHSMEPGLRSGDFLIGFKLPFGFRLPYSDKRIGGRLPIRGEVLIFSCPADPTLLCIKRVLGLPGDRVEFNRGRITVNGDVAQYEKADSESEFYQETLQERSWRILPGVSRKKDTFGPMIIPPGTFFALSDSRAHGEDSRSWGPVPLSYIESKVIFTWMGLDWGQEKEKSWPSLRWDRVFKWVD